MISTGSAFMEDWKGDLLAGDMARLQDALATM